MHPPKERLDPIIFVPPRYAARKGDFMCEYCFSSPHVRGCPAGDDDDEKYPNKCSYCGGLFPDNEGVKIGTDYYCEECVDNFDLDDVLQTLGLDSTKELLKELA